MIQSVLGSQIMIILFAGLLLYAAWSDVVSYKIPNKAVIAILATYPAYVLVNPAPVDWLLGLAAFAITLVVGFGLFATGKFGAGDAKLLAAVMLWAGPALAPIALIVCTVSGGLLALIMMSKLRRVFADALSSAGREAAGEAVRSKEMPYGVPIALGGFVVCWALFASSMLNG